VLQEFQLETEFSRSDAHVGGVDFNDGRAPDMGADELLATGDGFSVYDVG
jgi:hypothetical protein